MTERYIDKMEEREAKVKRLVEAARAYMGAVETGYSTESRYLFTNDLIRAIQEVEK